MDLSLINSVCNRIKAVKMSKIILHHHTFIKAENRAYTRRTANNRHSFKMFKWTDWHQAQRLFSLLTTRGHLQDSNVLLVLSGAFPVCKIKKATGLLFWLLVSWLCFCLALLQLLLILTCPFFTILWTVYFWFRLHSSRFACFLGEEFGPGVFFHSAFWSICKWIRIPCLKRRFRNLLN